MKTRFILLALILSFFTGKVCSQTVYVTKTGTKYHIESCRYLSNSSYSMKLADAIEKGYTPCSVCKPSSKITEPGSTKSTVKPGESNSLQQTTKPPESTKSNSGSVQCSAITKAGSRCKRMTTSPNGKCWQHGGN